MMTDKNSEFERTTVLLPVGMIAEMKTVAKNKGMTQSGFIRFSILTTIEQFSKPIEMR